MHVERKLVLTGVETSAHWKECMSEPPKQTSNVSSCLLSELQEPIRVLSLLNLFNCRSQSLEFRVQHSGNGQIQVHVSLSSSLHTHLLNTLPDLSHQRDNEHGESNHRPPTAWPICTLQPENHYKRSKLSKNVYHHHHPEQTPNAASLSTREQSTNNHQWLVDAQWASATSMNEKSFNSLSQEQRRAKLEQSF